jgi:hypothetical protein
LAPTALVSRQTNSVKIPQKFLFAFKLISLQSLDQLHAAASRDLVEDDVVDAVELGAPLLDEAVLGALQSAYVQV